MDVQVNLETLIELQKQRISDSTHEALMLQAVVLQQREEITQLKEMIDRLAKESDDGSEGEGIEGRSPKRAARTSRRSGQEQGDQDGGGGEGSSGGASAE